MSEEWKQTVGYPNYEISSLGRVRRNAPGYGTRVGRVLKPKVSRWGYLEVTLYLDRKPCFERINRLVCRAFNGPAPEGKPFALHRDDVKSNNTPGNLYWGDRTENGEDARNNGRYPKSIAHRLAKVTPDDVRSIRKMAAAGTHTFKQIGELHNLSKSQAHKIATCNQHGDIQ